MCLIEPLRGEPCLFGELDQLGVAASVQGDEDSEHFAAHRVDLCHLGNGIPHLSSEVIPSRPSS